MDSRAIFSTAVTGHQQNVTFEVLGSDMLLAIANYLTFSEAYAWFVANKALYTVYESDDFWQQKFGACDRIDFICRLIVLDKELQISIIAATIKIAEGELTQHILNISCRERIPYFFPDSVHPAGIVSHFLSNKQRIIALREGLVTISQMTNNRDYEDFFKLPSGLSCLRDIPLREWLLQHTTMICEKGLTIFREKLLSRVEIENIYPTLATYFLNDYGLIALREKLITAEQIALIGHRSATRIELLLSDEGIQALRQKRITSEWVAELPHESAQLQSVLEEVKSQFINALVKDRLGNCFSYSDITLTFDVDALVVTYHSTITACLPQEHPAVKAVCGKLENPRFTINTKDIDGISTEITINHTEKNQLKNALKGMPKTETFEPETPPIDNVDNHIPGLFYFSFFATPLAEANLNAVQEATNRHSDATTPDVVSTVRNNQPT